MLTPEMPDKSGPLTHMLIVDPRQFLWDLVSLAGKKGEMGRVLEVERAGQQRPYQSNGSPRGSEAGLASHGLLVGLWSEQ